MSPGPFCVDALAFGEPSAPRRLVVTCVYRVANLGLAVRVEGGGGGIIVALLW